MTHEVHPVCAEDRRPRRGPRGNALSAWVNPRFNRRHHGPEVPAFQLDPASGVGLALLLRLRDVRDRLHLHKGPPCPGRYPS